MSSIPDKCSFCLKPILLTNLFVDDGCPCNSPRGINFIPRPCTLCKTNDCVKPGHHIEKHFGDYHGVGLVSKPAKRTFEVVGLEEKLIAAAGLALGGESVRIPTDLGEVLVTKAPPRPDAGFAINDIREVVGNVRIEQIFVADDGEDPRRMYILTSYGPEMTDTGYPAAVARMLRHMNEEKNERAEITHVAVRVDGVVWALPRPYRHHHILNQLLPTFGKPYPEAGEKDQGFLDAKGRYLTRKQALISAQIFNQIKHDGKIIGGVLTSEDLWEFKNPKS